MYKSIRELILEAKKEGKIVELRDESYMLVDPNLDEGTQLADIPCELTGDGLAYEAAIRVPHLCTPLTGLPQGWCLTIANQEAKVLPKLPPPFDRYMPPKTKEDYQRMVRDEKSKLGGSITEIFHRTKPYPAYHAWIGHLIFAYSSSSLYSDNILEYYLYGSFQRPAEATQVLFSSLQARGRPQGKPMDYESAEATKLGAIKSLKDLPVAWKQIILDYEYLRTAALLDYPAENIPSNLHTTDLATAEVHKNDVLTRIQAKAAELSVDEQLELIHSFKGLTDTESLKKLLFTLTENIVFKPKKQQ